MAQVNGHGYNYESGSDLGIFGGLFTIIIFILTLMFFEWEYFNTTTIHDYIREQLIIYYKMMI